MVTTKFVLFFWYNTRMRENRKLFKIQLPFLFLIVSAFFVGCMKILYVITYIGLELSISI